MQINLSANLSNPAGETNAKSAEVAEADAANGFFAQMGQMLNQGNEIKKAQAAPEPSVPASNSAEKNARRMLQSTSLLLPQALTVGQAPVSTAEKGIADLHPSAQFPGDSGVTVGAPPLVNVVDSEHHAELPSSVNQTGNRLSPLTGKRIAMGMADRVSPEEPPRIMTGVSIDPEGHAEYPTKPAGDAIQNFQMLDLQKEYTPQPEWYVAPKVAETVNDLVVSRNSMQQIQDLRAALQAGLENAPQSVPGHARAGNEADMWAVSQDQALSAQLNFDFIAAGATALRQGMPGQPAGIAETQDLSFADKLALSENAGLQIDDSPVTILRKSLKTMPASLENSDAATAAAVQGQTLDKARPWMTLQGKLEDGQLHSGQQQLSNAERQPQMQSVFASSPAQYGELADSVSAPPAQSSTSQEPELYSQLADQIRIQLRDGKGEIRIQLKPDSLGRLEIRAENTAHGVSARISTDSSAVKSYLENNLQLLQQTLQDQGLKIDRIHIVVQDAFDPQSSSGYTAQFGHAGSGQNGKEPQLFSGKSSASHMNPIDETGLDSASWFALNPNSRFYTVA